MDEQKRSHNHVIQGLSVPDNFNPKQLTDDELKVKCTELVKKHCGSKAGLWRIQVAGLAYYCLQQLNDKVRLTKNADALREAMVILQSVKKKASKRELE